MSNTAQEILDAVGGPGNITHFTHCATRLRFELNDASIIDKDRVEAIDGVLGAVPQSGDRYQIVIGGAVQSVFNEINNLPSMKSGATVSNDDVKAAARAKARGKNAIVDAFFEYLSDSFRPLLPVLLGASLILAFLAVAAVCTFLLGFTSSWGPIFSIVMGEMFPNSIRGGAMSLASGADFLVNFLVVLLFPFLIGWSPAGTYWIYCAFGVLAVIFTAKFLTETSGAELEDMDKVVTQK